MRTALTPHQKQLRKDWELQQQVERNELASFEELWEYQKDSDSVQNAIETLSMYREDELASEIEAEVENRFDLTPDDDGYDEAAAEIEEEVAAAYFLPVVKDEYEYRYDDSVWRIENELDGQDCWRAVDLPRSIDPSRHDGLGIYWSYREEGADVYWAPAKGPTQRVVYRARIDARYIDLSGTVEANIDADLGEREAEVRFLLHAPLFVYDVRLRDGTVIEINATRRT